MRQIRYSTVHARLFLYVQVIAFHGWSSYHFPRLCAKLILLFFGIQNIPWCIFDNQSLIFSSDSLNSSFKQSCAIHYLHLSRNLKKFDLVTSSNLLGSHRYNFTTALHKVHFILVPFQSNRVEEMGFCFRLSISLWLMLAMCFADSEVDERCFDKSCGKEFDPKGPLVHCNFL